VKRVLIMGAAGRDFHNFNVCLRDDPHVRVVAFTAAQIPGIAGRAYPAALAGPNYPDGIPIRPESELEQIVREELVDVVIFAYSDVSHATVMHAASRVLACGADFELLGPHRTMLQSSVPVVAVGATRTGAGKSATARLVGGLLERAGLRTVVVRHPMPYGDLVAERVQRFADYGDLERHGVTIEEREEYEGHLEAGRVVYAGVDYRAILRRAEAEADVIIWDGGNNDYPFYRPDLFIVVADPLRPGDELGYHPGETNVRLADVIVINKVDTASPAQIRQVEDNISKANPAAIIIHAESKLSLHGGTVAGARVVVVEDGPTLTHGGMHFGAGIVAARRFGAKRIVDPTPYAVGSIADALAAYPELEKLVPALGYSKEQIAELEATLNAVPADVVLAGTPINLGRLLKLDKPVVRVRYETEQVSGFPLGELLRPIRDRARRLPAAV
jgi:predicted GTPase